MIEAVHVLDIQIILHRLYNRVTVSHLCNIARADVEGLLSEIFELCDISRWKLIDEVHFGVVLTFKYRVDVSAFIPYKFVLS
jgi:hypothetical protein